MMSRSSRTRRWKKHIHDSGANLLQNGHDEFRVATNFAHKSDPFVEKLEAAMSALEENVRR